MANTIITTLFETPRVTNFSHVPEFEVQPGVHSPVYINFKAALAVTASRKKIAQALATAAKDTGASHVVGIESGGSYYASYVADKLNTSLILYRKEKKSYNITNHFAGEVPHKGDMVVVVDDVMSSGNTVSPAVEKFASIGCNVIVIVGFSYCWEKTIANNLGVPIIALSTAEDLIRTGKALGRIDDVHEGLIREYVASEADRVVKRGASHA